MFELPPPSYPAGSPGSLSWPNFASYIGNLLLHGSSTSHFVWSDRLPREKTPHTVDGSEIRRTHLGMYPKPLMKKMVDFNYQPQIGRNSSWSTGLSRIANKDRQICRLHRPRRPQLEPEELDLAAAVMKKTNPRFLDEDVGKVAYNS